MPAAVTESVLTELATAERKRRGIRKLKDKLFGLTMGIGGVTVIVAILTIFVFLLWVVLPLFRSASMTPVKTLQVDDEAVVQIALNEYADIGFLLRTNGAYRFYRTDDGTEVNHGALSLGGRAPRLVAPSTNTAKTIGILVGARKVLLAQPAYHVSFVDNRRQTNPEVIYPLGEEGIDAAPAGTRVTKFVATANEAGATIVALTVDGRAFLTSITKTESLLDEAGFEESQTELANGIKDVDFLVMDIDQREVYFVSRGGLVRFYDIREPAAPHLVEEVQVVEPDVTVTAVEFLSGGTSLLIGDSKGRIAQWFPVRDDENNYRLTRIRSFKKFDSPVQLIVPEYYRKGFAALAADGALGLFHTTAERTLLIIPDAVSGAAVAAAIAPHANSLTVLTASGALQKFKVTNKHPEVSWHSLWGKVWYEGRTGPEFIWQSSSASSDFEPKFSLTPLTFGTIKAAFYAMLFAIPIAIFGAVYTAYFMQPRMRTVVKPSIEIMAALPTVILGFLAGLWLAPLIETHLIGVLTATALMPLAWFVTSFGWSRLPLDVRRRVPGGWEALLLVPVVVLVLWGTMALSQPLEELFFGGNLPRWLAQELGITYDQRNSLVVGIAMGFAVIPNIYSIAEDAVFGVPRQLSTGSLALGATPWQTVTRVVLLTASPGIFSAVMIGLGRAVGETMIVLMSTGNTPIMDLNMFQGFRALSANIAVEMPESEVNSTHFRVLFLAALVLFAVTFVFNTVAEVVRQRLRAKYSNL